MLSILVTRAAIVIAQSRGNGVQEIPRDGTERQRLIDALRALKRTAPFADRADLELAAASDAVYGDLVMVIDAASAEGFPRWAVTEPGALSMSR